MNWRKRAAKAANIGPKTPTHGTFQSDFTQNLREPQHGYKGFGETPRPWYVAQRPWPFWGAASRKKAISVGNPQHVLTAASVRLGFSLGVNLAGSNASGSMGGNYPATVGSVLNLSAAAFASGAAFSQWNGKATE